MRLNLQRVQTSATVSSRSLADTDDREKSWPHSLSLQRWSQEKVLSEIKKKKSPNDRDGLRGVGDETGKEWRQCFWEQVPFCEVRDRGGRLVELFIWRRLGIPSAVSLLGLKSLDFWWISSLFVLSQSCYLAHVLYQEAALLICIQLVQLINLCQELLARS